MGFSRLDSWHRSLICRCHLHGTYLFRCHSFPRKDIIKLFLWSFGAFVLIYTGIESLKMQIKLALVIREMMIQLLKLFLVFMSLSNPLTILFWLGIFGSILAKAASSYNKEQLLLYSFRIILGILFGILRWQVHLVYFVKF